MLYGHSGDPPAASYRTSGIPLESVLLGWLETSVVVAQQLIKSTTSVWIGMGPGAGRVDNNRLALAKVNNSLSHISHSVLAL